MKRFACIFNPQSGSAVSADDIANAFEAAGAQIDCFEIQQGKEELQKQIKKGSYVAVVAAGGDGTVNMAADIAVFLDLPLGVLPVGTLNHFAKDCGLPLDFQEAVNVICQGKLRAMDYCTANDKLFLNNASIGIYPSVVLSRERKNYVSKLLATVTTFTAALFKDNTLRAEVTDGDFKMTLRSPLIFIGNNHYELEKAGFSKRHDLRSGELFLYMVKATRASALLFLALLSVFGARHRRHDALRDTAGPITISANKVKTAVALDGEVEWLEFPLTFAMHHEGLRLYVPSET